MYESIHNEKWPLTRSNFCAGNLDLSLEFIEEKKILFPCPHSIMFNLFLFLHKQYCYKFPRHNLYFPTTSLLLEQSSPYGISLILIYTHLNQSSFKISLKFHSLNILSAINNPSIFDQKGLELLYDSTIPLLCIY